MTSNTDGAQDIDLGEGRAFADIWCDRVEATPGATFLVFRDDAGNVRSWTYEQFDATVGHAMQVMLARGVTPGSSVHLVLRNSPAFLAFWLACTRLGAWMVPVDPASGERDLHLQLERVGPRLGVCAKARRKAYAAAAERAGLDQVLELDETAVDVDLLAAEAAALPALPPLERPGPKDRIATMFTSGTTSRPKGVVLTQANYATLARVMSAVANLEARHRWFVTLPLFHGNAQYYCFTPAIAVGASVALTASFSAGGWVGSAHDLRATHASLFAAPIRMILARTPEDAPRLALEHVWFAQSLGQEHHRRFAEITGVTPRQLYGMTETVAIVTADVSEPPAHDVIGRPVQDRRVRLVDLSTGDEAGTGKPGMIHVAGRRGIDLFREYLDAPETTGRSFSEPIDADGTVWFATGDLATRDETGTLRFVGRADDVIKVSGENVSLTEVEAVLAQAPGVLEAAVVAKPDPVRDVVPIAYLVPRDAAEPPSTDDLNAWAERELAPAARPREWHLIDELPRTSVGKVRRFAVTDQATSQH
ncbi:AMP-binding protein [Streptomyces sp. NPDC005752]|uniref:class I adenylate-forming enzyme family protein n=1 Tax=Streptomyces sp. NPDC005752 TaxID=3157065 RepID=UPI0033C59C40